MSHVIEAEELEEGAEQELAHRQHNGHHEEQRAEARKSPSASSPSLMTAGE